MNKRDDNVLALTYQDNGEMRFEFSAGKMAALVACFALGTGGALWFWGEEVKAAAVWAYWFLVFLCGAMVIGTIASLTTRRALVVNNEKSEVAFKAKTLLTNDEWTRSWEEFKEIRIYRPKVGTGAGRAALLRVLLVTKKGEEIPLGTGWLGIRGKEQARMLAEQLASMMSLMIIEEPSVEHRW